MSPSLARRGSIAALRLALGALLPARLPASTGSSIVISPSGSDSTGDGSVGNPYKTVSKLLSVIGPNQFGYLRSGTYDENVTMTASGTAGQPITLATYPGDTIALFKGAFKMQGAQYVRISRIEMTQGTTTPANRVVLWLNSVDFVELIYLDVHDTLMSGVYVGDPDTGGGQSTYVHILNSKFHSCGSHSNLDHGIYFGYCTTGGMVVNCLAYDNFANGIKIAPQVVGGVIACNVAYNNGRSGIITGGDPTYVSDSCIFVGNIVEKNQSSWGIRSFWDVIPPPAAPTLAQSATGSLVVGTTYSYEVTAITAAGETNPSSVTALAVTAGNGRITVTWPSVLNATGYKVYGRSVQTLGSNYDTDTFTRTTANDFGTADVGGAWTRQNGAAASFSTTGTIGRIIHVAGSNEAITLPTAQADVDVKVKLAISAAPAPGGEIDYQLVARYQNDSNFYRAKLAHFGSGEIDLYIDKMISGVVTNLAAARIVVGTYTPGDFYWLRLRIVGSTLFAKAWKDGTAEPDWMRTASDSAIAGAGSCGLRVSNSGGTVATPTMSVDSFTVDQAIGLGPVLLGTTGAGVLSFIDDGSVTPTTVPPATNTAQFIGTNMQVTNNLGWQNPGGDFTNTFGGLTLSGNISADPLFTNEATRDFHIGSSSPARGLGLAAYTPTTDYEDHGRAIVEAGAYVG